MFEALWDAQYVPCPGSVDSEWFGGKKGKDRSEIMQRCVDRGCVALLRGLNAFSLANRPQKSFPVDFSTTASEDMTDCQSARSSLLFTVY